MQLILPSLKDFCLAQNTIVENAECHLHSSAFLHFNRIIDLSIHFSAALSCYLKFYHVIVIVATLRKCTINKFNVASGKRCYCKCDQRSLKCSLLKLSSHTASSSCKVLLVNLSYAQNTWVQGCQDIFVRTMLKFNETHNGKEINYTGSNIKSNKTVELNREHHHKELKEGRTDWLYCSRALLWCIVIIVVVVLSVVSKGKKILEGV